MCWIELKESKKGLVKARLAKHLRALGLDSYSDYVDLIMNDDTGVELSVMIDILTTNYTSFFRGQDHFDYLRDQLLPKAMDLRRQKIRFWSAGCSSGEEAYSIAITCAETIPHIDIVDVLILGTDISLSMLDAARKGVYRSERVKSISPMIRSKYFNAVNEGKNDLYKVSQKIRELIQFRRHNLAGKWPMSGPFNAVFCRNVMIYFSKNAKKALLKRFHNVLGPEGVLFIGHSESLKGLTKQFKYIAPGIYERI